MFFRSKQGWFFREFVPKNPAKFDFFFRDLSEALSKAFPWIIFVVLFSVSNHQIVDEKNYTEFIFSEVKFLH